MTRTLQPPAYTAPDGQATTVEGTPLSTSHTRPPSYQEPSIMTTMDEKKGDIEFITRNVSATSSTCPLSTCPSKLPKAYYVTPQSRTRSCGGCCGKTSATAAPPTAPQVLSTSFMLLSDALSGPAMQKPTSRADAKTNIQALKLVLREVKALRRGCHLSCQEKKALKRELRPMEDDVKGVLEDLKREKCRMS